MGDKTFEFINAISTGADVELDEDYNTYLTNRAFSYYLETILLVNEVNRKGLVDKDMHYDFMQSAIQPKRKRFSKWAKPVKQRAASLISRFYNVPISHAYTYEKLFSEEEINKLEEMLIGD